MRADGTSGRTLIERPGNVVATLPPAWSPDGRWLAVAVWAGLQYGPSGIGALQLVAMPIGEEGIRLPDAVSGASWSPDGGRLAFAKVDGDGVALYTIAADGSDARRLTSIAGWHLGLTSREPDPNRARITVEWSPDGSKILYSCGLALCVVDMDGNHVGRTPARHWTYLDSWDRLGQKAAWSPDSYADRREPIRR